MNKKILSVSAALLAMAAVTFTSCKKDDETTPTTPAQTNEQKLIGNWLYVWSSIDLNSNGTYEANEVDTATAGTVQAYRFMTGGVLVDTTSFSGSGDTSMGTWTLYNSDMVATHIGNYRDTMKIISVDGTTLRLADVLNGVVFPYIDTYTKY